MTRYRHLFSSESPMNELDAVSMAKKRDPRVQKTTIFEDRSPFMFCKVVSKRGIEGIILSEKPLRTFHCIFQHSVWIPFYVGKYHAVFTDGGQNFPGYLVKNINFVNLNLGKMVSAVNGTDDIMKVVTEEDIPDVEEFFENDELMRSKDASKDTTAEVVQTSRSRDKDVDSFDRPFEKSSSKDNLI